MLCKHIFTLPQYLLQYKTNIGWEVLTWFEIVKNSLKSLGEFYKNNTWEILQSIEILYIYCMVLYTII